MSGSCGQWPSSGGERATGRRRPLGRAGAFAPAPSALIVGIIFYMASASRRSRRVARRQAGVISQGLNREPDFRVMLLCNAGVGQRRRYPSFEGDRGAEGVGSPSKPGMRHAASLSQIPPQLDGGWPGSASRSPRCAAARGGQWLAAGRARPLPPAARARPQPCWHRGRAGPAPAAATTRPLPQPPPRGLRGATNTTSALQAPRGVHSSSG
jgi:hypothetical protein